MASKDVTATPKIRSRKDGAAVKLSDLDRKLLDLMQGSFPIAARPYEAVALEAGITEDEVLASVERLLKDRIIRQVTPIYDTRALGYGSMLVAAKVDPEHPWRAAQIVNSHPGVSHNYLRNHDFNMWFTLAVEDDSQLGLQGTLDVLLDLTGAESIRRWLLTGASPTATSAQLTPIGLTRFSRWLTGARRKNATRSLTRSQLSFRSKSEQRSTQAPSSRRFACSTSPMISAIGSGSTVASSERFAARHALR